MPLGGYCTACQRWVWLTPYGECQNGHPALAVKDVQQLKPQSEPDLLVGEIVDEGPRRARFRWWWRHSLWICWTFTLGFMNWLGFVYVGVRARHTPWTLFGFAYLVPLLLTITAVATALPVWPFFLVQLLVSALSVVHALYVRPYYRAIMFGDASPRSLPAAPQPPTLAAGARPQLPKNIDERAAEVLKPARRQVDAILRTAGSMGKPAVRDEVVGLCATADQIIAELAAQPRKLDAARASPCKANYELVFPVFELVDRAGLSAHKILRPLHGVVKNLFDIQGGVDQGAGAKNRRQLSAIKGFSGFFFAVGFFHDCPPWGRGKTPCV